MNKENRILAVCVAVLPPLWAVLAPYIGVSTGAVALICGGLYVTNGNKLSDALRLTIGFLLGDLWALIVVVLTDRLTFNPDVELFITLGILGALAVIISELLKKWIFCPAWLCGWAIGLTVLTMVDISQVRSYFIQIAVAMLAGVWYVGALLNIAQHKLMNLRKAGN